MANDCEENPHTRKKCSKCSTLSLISDFYKKGDRFDAVCKSCKKSSVLASRDKKRQDMENQEAASLVEIKREIKAERIIEPRNQETNQIINSIDFSDAEHCCGKQMTLVEKHDAIWRFNEFIAILLDGYSELKGEDVYIKN